MLKVSKSGLLLFAGAVWSAAGISILSIGLPALVRVFSWLGLLFAVAVCAVFYLFIFSRLVRKHDKRIAEYPEPRQPFYRFFDGPSYAIMAFMMSGGILLRTTGLVRDGFVGPFYSGLGIALFVCGIRFLLLYRVRKSA